jgi:hypothetical protein
VYSQHGVPSGVVEDVGGVASGTIAVAGEVLFAANATVSDVSGRAGKMPILFWIPSTLK